MKNFQFQAAVVVAREEVQQAPLVHFPRPGSPGSQVQENQPEQVLQEVVVALVVVAQLEAVAETRLRRQKRGPCGQLLPVRAPEPGVRGSPFAHEVGPCAGVQK